LFPFTQYIKCNVGCNNGNKYQVHCVAITYIDISGENVLNRDLMLLCVWLRADCLSALTLNSRQVPSVHLPIRCNKTNINYQNIYTVNIKYFRNSMNVKVTTQSCINTGTSFYCLLVSFLHLFIYSSWSLPMVCGSRVR
jgi:hypothetical protein